MKYFTPEQIDNLDERTWGGPDNPSLQLTRNEMYALIKEVRRLNGEIAMLTDTVVMAAALWFKQIDEYSSEGGSASEALHEVAKDLVESNPRLAGSFRPEV